MVTAGLAGFAYTVPSGWIPGILVCALLQGGGFGIVWPFASRRIIEAAPDDEREIAASAFSTLAAHGLRDRRRAGWNDRQYLRLFRWLHPRSRGRRFGDFVPRFLPIALLGCLAAWRLASLPAKPSREAN